MIGSGCLSEAPLRRVTIAVPRTTKNPVLRIQNGVMQTSGALSNPRRHIHFIALTNLVSFDFWFDALFLWIIPFAAISSRNFTADRSAFVASSFALAVRTFLMSVFIRVSAALFRMALRAYWRARFSADLCCGIQFSLFLQKKSSFHS